MASSDPGLAGGPYELARCARCGSAVTLGGGGSAELHESGAYGGGPPRLSGLAGPLLRRFDRRRLGLVASAGVLAPARLLDVGAGRGRFVASAAAAGYEAIGIEPSARGVAGASELGVPVARCAVEQASFEAGSFEAVCLWHVLEHLDDPGAALERVAGWLAPGGVLVVGAPNLGSVQARVGGARWYHLDVPRHRVHFTAGGLGALVSRCGFEVVAVEHVLLEHNPFGMWQSLVNRFTRRPSYLYNVLKRNAPVWSVDLVLTVLALPLAPVAALAELAAGLSGRGGTVAVVARRVG